MSDQQQPRRYTLRRHKGYRLPPNTIVVARPHEFGNPFRVKKAESGEGYVVLHPAGITLSPFDDLASAQTFAVEWFHQSIKASRHEVPSVTTIIEKLRGKNLACWCGPRAVCHGDLLLRIANPGIVL